MFVEIGGTHEYWKRQDAVQVIALLVWEGLGLGGGAAVGNWNGEKDKNKILLGLGGGHYAPRHMDIVLKDGVWVGHLLSGYSLPMEDPNQSKAGTNAKDTKDIGGAWKHAIKAAFCRAKNIQKATCGFFGQKGQKYPCSTTRFLRASSGQPSFNQDRSAKNR
ncbi:D-aminoacyl-tRNA deacylase-like [Malus domestica]|uniref:D-aminoacyl-tRNA deacylase-like n=1 Tax=Malus domestica TaxID=3750 RepID=UPI003976EEF7